MLDVERSQPAPASLATGTRYSADDVRERLREDFHGKCYLCETVVGAGQTIDHRRPQALFPDERTTWENLFPACHGCNGSRRYTEASWPAEGLLDPGQGVESRLLQWLDRDMYPCFCAADGSDAPAVHTAAELSTLHRRTTSKGADLRAAISRQLNRVWEAVGRYFRVVGTGNDPSVRELETELRTAFSRRAPFTMLVRSKFRRYPELTRLFD